MMPHQLFTLGHSAMEAPTFVKLLNHFEISLLIDVRSNPRSLRFPHFDREELTATLKLAGIQYLFLGEELGGRPEDLKAYRSDGVVDYRARRSSASFHMGIDIVVGELEQRNLALMCAEEDPLTCHRFLMICPELVSLGLAPQHVRKGAVIETQQAAEDRLLKTQKLAAVAGPSLFAVDRQSALESAYLEQSRKCAFRIDPSALELW
jgi:uncharacterized protein (DUF488 family)